jgi:hypothetical protein
VLVCLTGLRLLALRRRGGGTGGAK